MKKNETLLETTLFVLRNYVEYDNYGKDKKKAVKVILKKHLNVNEVDIAVLFDFYEIIFGESLKVLPDFKKKLPVDNKYAQFEDIDFAKMSENLSKKFPDAETEGIKMIVSWSIFWHYLK